MARRASIAITVYPGDTPPEAIVVEPGSAFEWAVGEPISFEGEAWDEEDGVLATTSLDWSTRLFHCPAGCHAHPLQAFPAVASGSFPAPDHEYPSYIQLRLTATDSRGLSAWQTVDIYPKTVQLIVTASTPGLLVGVGLENRPGPLRLTAIEDSSVQLSAPATQQLGGRTYTWEGWSDEGERVHTILAEGPAAYEAFYSTPEAPARSAGASAPTPTTPPSVAAPRTLLRGHPRKNEAGPAAKFAFSSDRPGSRFRCKLDRRPLRSCRSPKWYLHLAGGSHRFMVAAFDPASGAADPTPAVFRWSIAP